MEEVDSIPEGFGYPLPSKVVVYIDTDFDPHN